MLKKVVCFASMALVCSLLTSPSYGQLLGLYEFDGVGDGTSWDDAVNWAEILDPNGNPLGGGDPATPPAAVTSADIPLAGVSIDGTMPGMTALDVNIGTSVGVGSLTVSGGDLTLRDMFVGRDGGGANGGTLDISGGTVVAGDDITVGAGSIGTMTMSSGAASTGDDLFVNAGSSLDVTGGTINVGDRLVTDGDGIVTVDGGDVIADDDFFFFGSSQITVDSGLMEVKDKLRFDDALTTGLLTVNGGLVRSQEFGFVDGGGNYIMNGTLEINGTGIYQSQEPGVGSPISQLSINHAFALIADGTITTSETGSLGLKVGSVVVPDFFGSSNLTFTQISIGLVPEPSSIVLMGMGVLGLALRRRRA